MSLAALLLAGAARADEVIYRGIVTMEDGSPPNRPVSIQRVCDGLDPRRETAVSAKTGEYWVRMTIDSFGGPMASMDGLSLLSCQLEAYSTGFTSSKIDLTDWKILHNPKLPAIILTPAPKADAVVLTPYVPHSAARPWNLAVKQLLAKDWEGAETSLNTVVKVAPKFSAGWSALGSSYVALGKSEEARNALQRAVELSPKTLQPYLMLARAQLDLKDWRGAVETTDKLLAADNKHVFFEAHLVAAMARYQMKDFDGALAQANEAIRQDKRHELPRAEYVLGVILEARKDYDAATQHMKAYLTENPRADDAATVNNRIANIGKEPVADLSVEINTANLRMSAAGEAPVPGGMKAFAAVAHLEGTPSYKDFFLQYCRALTSGNINTSNPTRDSGDAVRLFINSMLTLETLGERRADSTLIHLSFATSDQVKRSAGIFATLGWKLTANGDGFSLEPGEGPTDGFRQEALTALGVDELGLRHAIATKQEFEFSIPTETARLLGGAAWGLILKGLPEIAGGPAQVFTVDPRFARVYSGLGSLDGDSASAVVSAIGLANLITKYSYQMADYGEALTVTDKHVVVPGGAGAHAAWAKLAGANPQDAPAFLRALFEKDRGRLLTFYYDMSHADAAHRQYFTQTGDRAEAYYHWYRDSGLPSSFTAIPRWQAGILHTLRIDESGKLALPGGREAWGAGSENDDELLLRHVPLPALAAIATLEQKRGALLKPAAVRILAQNYQRWSSLFPYFEKLTALDAPDFEALAGFEKEAAAAPAARRNVLLGEWHSLVELIVLGAQAGSFNAAQAEHAFRQTCDALRSENPSAKAVEAVQEWAGAGDVDEAIASRLLRLSGARRDAFDKVKALQGVPRIAANDANKTLAALSGTVYAALLDPSYLLVAEDPGLLSRHNFVPLSDEQLFAPSAMVISSTPPGTNFIGGFGTFLDVAGALHSRTVGQMLAATETTASAAGATALGGEHPTAEHGPGGAEPANDVVFKAGGRIVEAYATVTDSRGRYVDNLSAGQFAVREQGQTKPVFAFENHTSAVSVALVFDTTGSMVSALPPLKNAALALIDELRDTDSVAVYSFNDAVTELQPFTADKAAAKRAILKTHAAGITALYDALVRVNHDLSQRTGKKVIIVFTDGNDNSSMLTADIAIDRARGRGIPIYTIAEGEALLQPKLVADLNNMSRSTGGTPFQIRKLSDISTVFEKVSQDLLHGYLVAFQPDPGDNHVWRTIEVVVQGPKGLQVRAREGFYIE